MAHINFVISQNVKWGHAGFYIDCHRMTVPENILLQKKHCPHCINKKPHERTTANRWKTWSASILQFAVVRGDNCMMH